MKTKKEIYDWLDNQINAQEVKNTPLYNDDSLYICIAGTTGEKKIHVYGIDDLCKELEIPYNEERHDDEYNSHYFRYCDYKVFGLVRREENS